MTFVKLEKLALLAKKKSLFDDRPAEIEDLTYMIKQDINSLNKQIAQLQRVSRNPLLLRIVFYPHARLTYVSSFDFESPSSWDRLHDVRGVLTPDLSSTVGKRATKLFRKAYGDAFGFDSIFTPDEISFDVH